MEKILNFIDGALVEPIGGEYFENVEPATGKAYSLIPQSDARDVEKAMQAAKKAYPAWSKKTPEERHDALMALSQGIADRFEDFVKGESKDNGKPQSLARAVDIPRAISNFKFYATAAMHYSSQSHHMRGSAINFTLRQPLGVIGAISPWNLPLYLFSWKIAPALAVGNTVVAKPSEVTPYTAYMLSKVCEEVGFPKGVLNIVHGFGPGAGEAIVQHDEIEAISFTGGTQTGKRIASIVAPKFKKMSLELGGKNPNIIFADCDYDAMLKTTIRSSFANQGQICLCGSRIFIERPIYEKFKKDFVEKVGRMTVGDPADDNTRMGAVVSKNHMEKVLSYIKLAEEEGGTILTGGNKIEMTGRCEDGFFIRPTVIEGLSYDCRTNQEEIFGPVVTIMPFDEEEEVLKYANSVMYGLSSTIWTSNLQRAHRMAERIEAGIVWINCWLVRDLRTPFGGVKASGIGREGGFEAFDFFTEPKNVCIKYD